MRSPGLVAVGTVFTVAGAVGIFTGMGFLVSSFGSCFDSLCSNDHRAALGAGILLGGAVLLGAGIPMIVSGARRVAPRYDPLATIRSPTIHIGPRGGAVTFQF